jgi:hypothetical protein
MELRLRTAGEIMADREVVYEKVGRHVGLVLFQMFWYPDYHSRQQYNMVHDL